MQETGRFLDEAQRAAALRALEDEFAMTLTEGQVFQAARLFLSMVSSSALTDPAAIAHEVRSQLAAEGEA
jgi:hypothetical protein